MAEIESQVADPSIAGFLYQCQAFRDRIRDGFISSEYPTGALRILQCFKLLLQRIENRLVSIQQTRGKNEQSGELASLSEYATMQANHLGNLLRELYSCLRFVHGSESRSTPPEIQTAISRLVQEHVIPTVGGEADSVVVLVRPRWTVPNVVDLLRYLEQKIEVADLDPDGESSAKDLRALIEWDWKQANYKGNPPHHIAVISFAGLDAYDALLYPLLAHEIGHFLDTSYQETITNNPSIQRRAITIQEVEKEFDDSYPTPNAYAANEPYRRERVKDLLKWVNQLVEVCLREVAADLLATRMLGVPYFITAAEYLKTVNTWPEETVTGTGYPGLAFRLKMIFEELTDQTAGLNAIVELEAAHSREGIPETVRNAVRRTLDYLRLWGQRCQVTTDPAGPHATILEDRLRYLARTRVLEVLPRVRHLVRSAIPSERTAKLPSYFCDLVAILAERVTPAQPLLTSETLNANTRDATFSDVLTAGWVYELGVGESREGLCSNSAEAYREYQNTCQLLFKAIELYEARNAIQSLDPSTAPPARSPAASSERSSGVASGPCILAAMIRADLTHRLFIVPYYNALPVNSATFDLRLGNWFRIARRTRATAIDLSRKTERERIRREAQEEEFVQFKGEFVLHPGDFALGVSLEYFAIPSDFMAFVEGKSSLGRTGLIVATATQVAPGFKGTIVLELFNSGTVPLQLRPGMSIAQLVFVQTDQPLPPAWLYSGSFGCQVKP